MIPKRLEDAVKQAMQAMAGALEAESHFFERAREFLNGALAINEAVTEVNRTTGGEGVTTEENAHLQKMVTCIQNYSNHLTALSKARAAHPFDVSPSTN